MPPRPSCWTYRRRCACRIQSRALCTFISTVNVGLKVAGGGIPALEIRLGRRGRAGQAAHVWRWAGVVTAGCWRSQSFCSALLQGVLRALFHYEQESSEQTPEEAAKAAAAPQVQEVDRSAVSSEVRHRSRPIFWSNVIMLVRSGWHEVCNHDRVGMKFAIMTVSHRRRRWWQPAALTVAGGSWL